MKNYMLFLACMVMAFSVFADSDQNRICINMKKSNYGLFFDVKTNYCLETELSSDGTCSKYKHSNKEGESYSINLGYKADGVTPATKIYITTMSCAVGKHPAGKAVKDTLVDFDDPNSYTTYDWSSPTSSGCGAVYVTKKHDRC